MQVALEEKYIHMTISNKVCPSANYYSYTTAFTKKLDKKGHVQSSPTRSNYPGFIWCLRKCCELEYDYCGTDRRFGTRTDVQRLHVIVPGIANLNVKTKMK